MTNHYEDMLEIMLKERRDKILLSKTAINLDDVHCPHCTEINLKPDWMTGKDFDKTLDMDCRICGTTFYFTASIKYSTRAAL